MTLSATAHPLQTKPYKEKVNLVIPPKAKVTRSNRVGCANPSMTNCRSEQGVLPVALAVLRFLPFGPGSRRARYGCFALKVEPSPILCASVTMDL
jgi:hypothetical protein